MSAVRLFFGYSASALGGAAFMAAALGQLGRLDLRLDVVNHFTPAIGLLALVALLMGLTSGRWQVRRIHMVIAALTMAMCAVQLAPEILKSAQPAEVKRPLGEHFRIVVFNVWIGNERGELAANWLIEQNADVVVLVEGRRVRQRLIDAGYQPSCYGCSPTIFARAKPLRRHPPPGVWDDPSGVTSATYADAKGEFTVVGVHGRWPTDVESLSAQAEKIEAHLSRADRARLIVAGDFNSTPWSLARQMADKEWGLIRRTIALPTWPAARLSHNRLPAPFPYLPIDHVYAGPGWATVSVERGPALGSDHYPVIVTLAPVNQPPT